MDNFDLLTVPQEDLYDTYLGIVAAVRGMRGDTLRDMADNPMIYALAYGAHVGYDQPEIMSAWNRLYAHTNRINILEIPYPLDEGIMLPLLEHSHAALEEVEVITGIDGLYSLGDGYVWLWSR